MTQGYGPRPVEPESKARPQGSGWRFLSFAAAALVLVPLVVVGGVEAAGNAQEYLDQRELEKSFEHGFATVLRMRTPAGTEPCQVQKATLEAAGQFCWRQATDIGRAQADFRSSFSSIGGKVIETRCAKDPAGVQACVMYGELEGHPFFANFARPRDKATGKLETSLRVSGGIDSGLTDQVQFQRTLPGEVPSPEEGWWGWDAPGPLDTPLVSTSLG